MIEPVKGISSGTGASPAGRSTAMFDYRIVATELGAAGQHMGISSPADAGALAAQIRARAER